MTADNANRDGRSTMTTDNGTQRPAAAQQGEQSTRLGPHKIRSHDFTFQQVQEHNQHHRDADRTIRAGLLHDVTDDDDEALARLRKLAFDGRPAYRGVAGEFVHLVLPHTESAPAALLFQFLTIFGTLVGNEPYWQVGATRHPPRLYTVVVGMSGTGRKGTALHEAMRPYDLALPGWRSDHERPGLSSDEGLADAVQSTVGYRTLVTAEEFASILVRAERQGNTLSTGLRMLWDGDRYAVQRRKDPVDLDGVHLGIITHITRRELAKEMNPSSVDRDNGFVNRFLYCAAHRSKDLPHGGYLRAEDLSGLTATLSERLEAARARSGPVTMSPRAERLWDEVYRRINAVLDADEHLAPLLARAHPYVLRVALIYCLLDGTTMILEQHVRAGLGVWLYSFHSLHAIFADIDKTWEDIVSELVHNAPDGVKRSEITHALQKKGANSDAVGRLLNRLESEDMVTQRKEPSQGSGRPAMIVRPAESSPE